MATVEEMTAKLRASNSSGAYDSALLALWRTTVDRALEEAAPEARPQMVRQALETLKELREAAIADRSQCAARLGEIQRGNSYRQGGHKSRHMVDVDA